MNSVSDGGGVGTRRPPKTSSAEALFHKFEKHAQKLHGRGECQCERSGEFEAGVIEDCLSI